MAEIGFIAAAIAGLLAFFSPCVIPIIPGFLTFIAGGAEASTRRRALRTGGFVLGFVIAFTIIGFLIGAAGQTAAFLAAEVWLRRVGGALIILFGLAMVGLLRPAWMDRDLRVHGVDERKLGPILTPLALGASFGVGWTPCVGPVLASILVFAGVGGSALDGALLLIVFSLGLGIPFMLFGLLADRATPMLRKFARASHFVEVGGGVLLIVLGILVFTGAINRLLIGGF